MLTTKFLKNVRKKLEAKENISLSLAPPRYWFSSGNFTLNKRLSGSFTRGLAQGRINILATIGSCDPSIKVDLSYINDEEYKE